MIAAPFSNRNLADFDGVSAALHPLLVTQKAIRKPELLVEPPVLSFRDIVSCADARSEQSPASPWDGWNVIASTD